MLDERIEHVLRTGRAETIRIVVGDSDPVDLPPAELKTLHKVVHALAEGDEPMLTTTEAAEMLGVSRPYLTQLLKAGKIPYRKKGNRHLVPLSAARNFKARRDHRLAELNQLAEAEEDLGIR